MKFNLWIELKIFITISGWFRVLYRLSKIKEFRLDVYLGCLSSYEDNSRFTFTGKKELGDYIKRVDVLCSNKVLGHGEFIFEYNNKENILDYFSHKKWVETYNYVVTHKDEYADYEHLYPFSHKKAKAIRRMRIRDILLWYDMMKKDKFFMNYHCDYEMMINIGIYFGCLPKDISGEVHDLWMEHIHGWSDKEDFRKNCKKLSNLVKRSKSDNAHLFMIELNYLTGAQLTKDWFNAKESLESFFPDLKLVRNRGTGTWVDWLHTYKKKMNEIMVIPKPLKIDRLFIDFNEFLKYGNWETGGVSEGTRVQVMYDKKVYKFKGRKNMMKEMADWDFIKWSILTNQEEIMTVIVKEEPGKVRHAFKTGDSLYFMAQYLNQFCGESLAAWPGYVLEEKPNGVFAKAFSKRRMKKYIYDFDFEGFDKQLSIEEQIILVGMFFAVAILNVETSFSGDDLKVTMAWLKFFRGRMISLLQRIKMKYKGFGYYDEEMKEVQIEIYTFILWGLMSGLYFTDKFGGGAQKIWREITMDFTKKMYASSDYGEYSDSFKGDDVEEESYKYSILSAHNWSTLGFGFKGAIGKFGIMPKGEGEFLRKGIRNESFIGYFARAIPGMSQMKPWLSEPSDIRETLIAVREAAVTIFNRGGTGEIISLFFIIVARMMIHYELNPYMVSVPTTLNGMGLATWDGKHIVDGKVRRGKEKMQIEQKNGWTKDIFEKRMEEIGVKANGIDKAVINFMKDKVSSKDIRELNRLEKGSLTYRYKTLKVRSFRDTFYIRNNFFMELKHLVRIWYNVNIDNHWLRRIESLLRREINYYGKWKRNLGELHILDYFDEKDIITGKREVLGPTYWDDIDWLVNKGFKKREAGKYLEGNGGCGAIIHQNLVKVVEFSYAWIVEKMFRRDIKMGVKERELIKFCINYSFNEYLIRTDLIRYFRF